MVDKEQLVELLKRGIKEWNEWRDDNPEVEVNLSRADLHRVDLVNANLNRANLCEANLFRAHLGNANLICANLIGASLENAILCEANLVHPRTVRKAKEKICDRSGGRLSPP